MTASTTPAAQLDDTTTPAGAVGAPITLTLTYDQAALLQYLLPLAAIDGRGRADVADSLIAALDQQLTPALAAAYPESAHLVGAMAPLVATARALIGTLRLDADLAYSLAIEAVEAGRSAQAAPAAPAAPLA